MVDNYKPSKILDTLDFAIDASNGNNSYFVGFRNGLRYAKSLIDGEEPQFEEDKMTKEQKDKIFKTLAEERNDYARECNNRITRENGKIIGADYMLQRFFNILRNEDESQESEDNNE